MRKIFDFILRLVATWMPVHRKWIAFDSFDGRGFGDSPGAIAREMLERGLPYKLFWLYRGPLTGDYLQGVVPVNRASAKGVLVLASSKVWVDNVKTGITLKKKKSQYYIQTWHGGGLPLKCVEGQAQDYLPDDYIAISKRDSAQTDMIVADNNLVAEVYRNFFWYPDSCEIACIGLPKNDVLYKNKDISLMKKKCFGDSEAFFALYAPTFRDDGDLTAFRINLKMVKKTLEQSDGRKWKIAVRLHPNIAGKSNIFEYDSDIIDVSSFPEAQELVLASDILLTDYSSIMSDFLALDKPIFLYLPDHEHYTMTCRNLSPVFERLPFPKSYDEQQLLAQISGFDREAYLAGVHEFKSSTFISYDDGNASKRVVDRIISL